MSYKIFACDLDGTLLDDNSNVSKDNFDEIEQIQFCHHQLLP